MKSLARTSVETVADELRILSESRTLQNLIAAIGLIIKERMTQMLHVNTDLMGATRLQSAFY